MSEVNFSSKGYEMNRNSQVLVEFQDVGTFQSRERRFHFASGELVSVVREKFEKRKLPLSKRKDVDPAGINVIMTIVLNRDYSRNPPGIMSFLEPEDGEEIIMNEAMAISGAFDLLDIEPFDEWIEWLKAFHGVSEFFGDHLEKRLKERNLW